MKQDATTLRTAKRARRIAELLMKEMHAGVREPARLCTEEWDKLFGAKQSMIANLQKLVATLGALQMVVDVHVPVGADVAVTAPLSVQEMTLLTAWLEEGRG